MTTAEAAHLFDHALAGASRFVDELADELGTNDPREARRVLKVVLHAIRDHLETHEVAHLAAQLPELVRGMYYEGWVPGRRGPRHSHDFLEQIARDAGLHGVTEASMAVAATMRVLRATISPGEIGHVLGEMPAEVRALLA